MPTDTIYFCETCQHETLHCFLPGCNRNGEHCGTCGTQYIDQTLTTVAERESENPSAVAGYAFVPPTWLTTDYTTQDAPPQNLTDPVDNPPRDEERRDFSRNPPDLVTLPSDRKAVIQDGRLVYVPNPDYVPQEATGRPSLKMAHKWIDAIRYQEKTTTIRDGWRDIPEGPLDLLFPSRKMLTVYVWSVYRGYYRNLTTADAVRDGHSDLDALQQSLRNIYSNLTYNSKISIIRFTLWPGEPDSE